MVPEPHVAEHEPHGPQLFQVQCTANQWLVSYLRLDMRIFVTWTRIRIAWRWSGWWSCTRCSPIKWSICSSWLSHSAWATWSWTWTPRAPVTPGAVHCTSMACLFCALDYIWRLSFTWTRICIAQRWRGWWSRTGCSPREWSICSSWLSHGAWATCSWTRAPRAPIVPCAINCKLAFYIKSLTIERKILCSPYLGRGLHCKLHFQKYSQCNSYLHLQLAHL